ncbi:Cys-rich peptide radical SAM maturase CcpM [Clostridium botulinum]|nr:Cys-rich peptide radical SAM maturase CcpM [Clostridium botulinum]
MLSDKPFIHLFKTMNNYYIFDVNKSRILKTDELTFKVLSNELNEKKEFIISESEKEKALKSINKLRLAGFLSSNRPKQIVHPADDLLEDRLKSMVERITLQITQECNLRCKYCVYSQDSPLQRHHSNKKMNFETAKKSIDFLFNHSIGRSRVNISFYGGEPLLQFDLIKQCVEYAKKKFAGREVTYSLTTNATLLNDDIIEYFVNNKFMITISLDGPKQIQDRNRHFVNGSGTFDTVITNLKKIRDNYPEFYKTLGINAVLDQSADYNCSNEFFTTNPVAKDAIILHTFINDQLFVEKTSFSEEFIINSNYSRFLMYLSMINKISGKSISRFDLNDLIQLKRISKSLSGDEGSINTKMHPSGPCVAGEYKLFVDVNGQLFPCERVSENFKVMRIGHIDTGFEVDKIKNIVNIGKLTEEECKKCWAIEHCSICVAGSADNKGFSKKVKLCNCINVKRNLEELFKDYVKLKELGCDIEYYEHYSN